MGQIQSLEEFISLLSRRRWLILVVALVGALMSAIYAKSRPDTYETAAVIQVESAAVQGVDGQRSSAAAATLQLIEQRLTTRENLAQVIERHGLYAGLPLSMDRKIDMLRGAVSFQGVDSVAAPGFGEQRALSAILVFARMDSPELAARVANDFAQGILDQSAAGQRAKADQNVLFFRAEVDRIGAQIAQVEALNVAYRNENAGNLPETREARRDEMVSLETDLRRQLQEKVGLENEAARISAKANLRETDRRALADLQASLVVLDAQIASARARQAEIQAELASAPEVEKVLAGYERQLEQLQNQQDAAIARMVQAETDARLAELQQAERFTLLERAIVPESAMGGGNKKLAVAGAAASLILGLVLAFVMDLIHPVVRTAAQMERQLDLRPVVSIPEIKPERAKRKPLLRGFGRSAEDKMVLGLPLYAVLSGAVTLVLLAAAALV
jgi:uncharacterized protein involved in exopolysaccharide biosynthesis